MKNKMKHYFRVLFFVNYFRYLFEQKKRFLFHSIQLPLIAPQLVVSYFHSISTTNLTHLIVVYLNHMMFLGMHTAPSIGQSGNFIGVLLNFTDNSLQKWLRTIFGESSTRRKDLVAQSESSNQVIARIFVFAK